MLHTEPAAKSCLITIKLIGKGRWNLMISLSVLSRDSAIMFNLTAVWRSFSSVFQNTSYASLFLRSAVINSGIMVGRTICIWELQCFTCAWPPKLPDWQKIHEGSELLYCSASERKRLFTVFLWGFLIYFFLLGRYSGHGFLVCFCLYWNWYIRSKATFKEISVDLANYRLSRNSL